MYLDIKNLHKIKDDIFDINNKLSENIEYLSDKAISDPSNVKLFKEISAFNKQFNNNVILIQICNFG